MAEEHMWARQLRAQLIIDLVHELAQRGESLTVADLDRYYLDARAERPGPGVEHRSAATSMVKAEEPHPLNRLSR